MWRHRDVNADAAMARRGVRAGRRAVPAVRAHSLILVSSGTHLGMAAEDKKTKLTEADLRRMMQSLQVGGAASAGDDAKSVRKL